MDVGKDSGAVVVDDYATPTGTFSNTIHKVVITVDAKNEDDPLGKARAHLARQ